MSRLVHCLIATIVVPRICSSVAILIFTIISCVTLISIVTITFSSLVLLLWFYFWSSGNFFGCLRRFIYQLLSVSDAGHFDFDVFVRRCVGVVFGEISLQVLIKLKSYCQIVGEYHK